VPPADLLEYLRQRLPAYMVPSAVVELAELPLTPNKKVDVGALPAPQAEPGRGVPHVEPRDEVERALAEMWARLIKIDKVGVRHTFVGLGGHSLLMIKAVSEIRKRFGVPLSVRTFIQDPTVEGIARYVRDYDTAGPREAAPTQPKIVPGPRSGRVSTSFIQESQILVCSDLEDPSYPMTSFLRLSGTLDVALLRDALDHVARRHDDLRVSFPDFPEATTALVAEADGFHWPLREVDLTGLGPDQRDAELHQLVQTFGRSLDVINGPVLDAVVVRVTETSWLFGISVDHLACDRISMGIVLGDISEVYNALHAGQRPDLPSLAFQFQDYAVAQREFLRTEQGRQLADQWVGQYQRRGALLPVLDLEPKYTLEPTAVGRLASVRRRLGGDFPRKMAAYCRDHEVTPYAMFLAALLLAVRPMSRTDALGVRMIESGRHWDGTSRLAGWFSHMLPMWVDVQREAGFDEVLAAVTEGVRHSIANSVPSLHLAREWSKRGGPPADTAKDMIEASRVPHILFLCDTTEAALPELRGVTASRYPFRYDEGYDYAPVITVVIEPFEGDWLVRVNYVEAGYPAETVERLLDGMVETVNRQCA
jgi:hypothetical protein